MKRFILILAIAMSIAIVSGVAMGESQARTVVGKVVKIDGGVLSVTPDGKVKDTINIQTDDNTKVTLSGKVAKMSDLKVGMTVVVTPDTGTASSIEATVPTGGGCGGGG